MNQTPYDLGIERGRRVGQLELVIPLLEQRFGALKAETRQHVEQLPIDDLRRLVLKIGTAASLEELGLPG